MVTPYELYTNLLKQVLTRAPLIDDPQARQNREKGLDWPADAETMIGLDRLSNIQTLLEALHKDRIKGDVMECGVWKGGATIFMRGVLKALGSDRVVWVADSFDGCPEPDPEHYPVDGNDPHYTFKFLAVTQEIVRRNFERWGLLDAQVQFLPGFFKDSLPGPVSDLALLRCDCDMYESMTQSLEAMYPRINPGGFVIIDDYYNIHRAQRAVNDFRTRHNIEIPLIPVDWCAAYWRK